MLTDEPWELVDDLFDRPADAARQPRSRGVRLVVGDAVWDLLAARRAGLSVGLMTDGHAVDELTRAGAFRVYRDPAELDASLDELGIVP